MDPKLTPALTLKFLVEALVLSRYKRPWGRTMPGKASAPETGLLMGSISSSNRPPARTVELAPSNLTSMATYWGPWRFVSVPAKIPKGPPALPVNMAVSASLWAAFACSSIRINPSPFPKWIAFGQEAPMAKLRPFSWVSP